jgi:HYR domain
MRIRLAVLFVVCVCIPFVVAADEITSIDPARILQGTIESSIIISGDGLAGSDSTTVVYSGPAGTFSIPVFDASSTQLFVPIPDPVAQTAGDYNVDVFATDVTGAVRHIGPATLTVIAVVTSGPPLLSMPESVVVEATDSDGAVVNYSVSAESQGGTGLVVNCDHPSGSRFPLDTTTVTCTAVDSFGTSSGTFVVVVGDFTGPTITVPGNIVTANPVVTFTATAVDSLDGPVPVTCSPASGSTFAFGLTTVDCVAHDAHQNYVHGFFTVFVSGGPPILQLPDDIFAEATSASGAAVSFSATALGGETVACSPASGSVFPLGTTAVQCSATNNAGTTNGTFNVTVIDSTPPMLILNDVVAEATGPSGAMVAYVATAHDLVDGNIVPSCTPVSGSQFPIGVTVVQCTATDAHGNAASGSFTVTVRDTTPPQIVSVKASPDTLWPPDHKMVPVTVTAIATDLVDPNPFVRIVSVSSNQPINGTGDGDAAPDWEITGSLTLNLRAERSGNVDRVYTITVAATDASGNTSEATVQVKVTQTSRARATR